MPWLLSICYARSVNRWQRVQSWPERARDGEAWTHEGPGVRGQAFVLCCGPKCIWWKPKAKVMMVRRGDLWVDQAMRVETP